VGILEVAQEPRLGKRIVYLEDEADCRGPLADILELNGHTVYSYESAEDAQHHLTDGDLDVAIVDVGLPILDGYQVAAEVRQHMGPAAPRMVAMTGYGQESDRRRARDAGFDRHLVKPAEMSEIIAVLKPKDSAESAPLPPAPAGRPPR